ncbi:MULTISPECIES: hypothetical protein [Gluconobacter]|nr:MULTISPECIES: hypothetical protein [Gluconobacter]KXV22269.1 hypothetical protein AD934_01595 [Gluconobacter oxydans]KXV35886.1 hypothetical protein AD939_01125 [Gluconobacter oxydans]KXV49341.1 hypothetical protein AD945_04665 [Gluconobacter albidus]MBF0857211.1 hypothetical protein [Gluconobacter oxydans]MBF0886738.1 hypothetical protein [Gluconobacter sphaericus]
MSKRRKTDLTAARKKAEVFGPDTVLFADLELGEAFRMAGAELGAVYRKVRRNHYMHDGKRCLASDGRAVKRASLPGTED